MQIDHRAILFIGAAILFILCAYTFSYALSMKKQAGNAKRRADEYMEKYIRLEAMLAGNEHRCSTCLAKNTCPHSLGDAGRHWIACPMWTGGEANKDPAQE